MMCSRCNKNEANVFYKQILNNKVTELKLCADCASTAAEGLAQQLLSAFAPFPSLKPPREARPLRCSGCGLRYSQFKESGRLGCATCYESFQDPLTEILKQIHGFSKHMGKRPSGTPVHSNHKARLETLREELKSAIREEAFEKASRIRDQIRELESP